LPYYLQNAINFTAAWFRQTPLLLPFALPIYALFDPAVAAKLVGAAAVTMAAIVIVRPPGRTGQRTIWIGRLVILLALIQTLAYAFFIQGSWFYHRYAASLGVLFNIVLIAYLYDRLSQRITHKWTTLALTAVILLCFSALLFGASYRWLIHGASAVPEDGFYETARYLDTNLPDGARVGVFQAGVIGYYAHQTVLPLDGKVSHPAREAIQAGEMFDYLCRESVDYLADWQRQIDNLLVRRTANWSPDNLELLYTIPVEDFNDLMVYAVRRSACMD
jgi:hypothetical protein